MSSTNKTTNYELSQYIGTDKPTYLGDYNSDMTKIDTQMKANSNAVEIAKTTADTALENAESAEQKANSAEQKATTATQTATEANVKANEVSVNLNNFKSEFNFTSIVRHDENDIGATGGTNHSIAIFVASDNSGKVGKFYGQASFQRASSGQIDYTMTTPLRPTEKIRIQSVGLVFGDNTLVGRVTAEVDTDGTLKLEVPTRANNNHNMYLFPCLYFMQNFGDE